MDEKLVTTDLILETLKGWVENKQPIDPHLWVDAAAKLNILKGDETKILYELQQQCAQMKVKYIEAGYSVAKAKAYTEASDLYRQMKVQEAKIEMIEEQVRISKVQARMGKNEILGY